MTDKADDYHWNKLVETLAQFPEAVDRIVERRVQPEISAPFYDARAILLPPNEVVELFPYDATRIRFYLRAATENTIQLGKRDALTADQGWIVATSSATEFHTVAGVYVKASVATTIYLWAEYRKG